MKEKASWFHKKLKNINSIKITVLSKNKNLT